jgi:dipeptidase E
LLLTSAGVTKQSIAVALQGLVGKLPNQTKIGYIPIAANVERGNKDWYINQFLNLWRFGYNWIDIIDPTATGVDWQSRLADVDVVFVGGGNTFHLLDQYRKTGFGDWLNEAVKTKVYVGVSSGSIVASPTIDACMIPEGDENIPNVTDLTGLGWVNFEIEPHCDDKRFAVLEEYAKSRNNSVYALDDQTAIVVNDSEVKVASEGSWKRFN